MPIQQAWQNISNNNQYLKSQYSEFFWSVVPVFWLNMEIYSVQIQYRKIWKRKSSEYNTDPFHIVNAWIVNKILPNLNGSTTWRFAVGLRAEEKFPISKRKMLWLSSINTNQSKYLKGPWKISVSGIVFWIFAGQRLATLPKWSLWWTILIYFQLLF